MSHAMLTMIAPLAPQRLADAQAEIAALGNPGIGTIRTALQPDPATGEGIHFASMHAFQSQHSDEGYLLLEISADGTEASAVDRLVAAIGPEVRRIFLMASDWRGGADLARYLRAHLLRVGGGWFDVPGLCFAERRVFQSAASSRKANSPTQLPIRLPRRRAARAASTGST